MDNSFGKGNFKHSIFTYFGVDLKISLNCGSIRWESEKMSFKFYFCKEKIVWIHNGMVNITELYNKASGRSEVAQSAINNVQCVCI